MTTAFQSNAFQGNAFQILGGQTGAGNGQYLSFVLDDISATINQGLEHTQAISFTLDDISITINQLSSNAPVVTAVGGGIGKKKQQLVIVDIDGIEYRVPQNKLQSFLDSIPKKIEEKKIQRKKLSKARFEPVEIEIKSAPIQFIEKIQTEPIYASLKANKLFLQAAIRYQQELDDEEAILLLM